MFELPTGPVTGFTQSARDGSSDEAEEESAELVSRRESARIVLGPGARVSSHRAHFDELCIARSIAAHIAGRIGKSLSAASGKSPRAETRFERARCGPRFAGGSSTLATQRGEGSGGRGRSGAAQALAHRAQHR